MELLKGDIIAVHGKGFISESIEVITHSPVSHIAIVIDPVNMQLIEAYESVKYRNLIDYKGMCEVYRCDLTDEQREKVVTYCLTNLNKPYDYVAILKELERYTLGIKPKAEDGKAFICSSLAAMAFLFAGISLTDEPLPSPADIVHSPRLKNLGGY